MPESGQHQFLLQFAQFLPPSFAVRNPPDFKSCLDRAFGFPDRSGGLVGCRMPARSLGSRACSFSTCVWLLDYAGPAGNLRDRFPQCGLPVASTLVRYSFLVGLFHPRLQAGLSRCLRLPTCAARQVQCVTSPRTASGGGRSVRRRCAAWGRCRRCGPATRGSLRRPATRAGRPPYTGSDTNRQNVPCAGAGPDGTHRRW